MKHLGLLTILIIGCAPPAAPVQARKAGDDWPCFLGLQHNGSSAETGILTKWNARGLKIIWEAEMGQGYAPPVVAQGRLYHVDRFGDNIRLTCRHAETGKMQWRYEYATTYEDYYNYSPGPRCSPLVHDGQVFVYGPEGMLVALDAISGKEQWKIDTHDKYHFHQNFFGVGSAPIVEGDNLIVAVGGSEGARPADFQKVKGNGSAIVAFERKTGKEVYRLSDELASYSTPITATIGKRRWCFYFARGGLIGFDPTNGKVDFHYPWRAVALESVNAATPVIVDDEVLITECYSKGAALLKVEPGSCKEIWTDADKGRDKSLRCHWNTPIYIDGHLYGSSGRHEEEAELRCVEWKTGEVKWRQKGLSRVSLTAIDGHLLALTERGELILFKPNSEKFTALARWEIDDLDYPCWGGGGYFAWVDLYSGEEPPNCSGVNSNHTLRNFGRCFRPLAVALL